MYEYLTWVAILGLAWIVLFLTYKLLRKKIVWSSLIALPFGLGELYFIPNYWEPQTLFNLGIKYHVDIESFGLMFFLGGIAAFIYEGFFKVRISRVQKICHPVCKCYTPLITSLSVFIIVIKLFPKLNIIYTSVLACLAGGIIALIIYPKLQKHILFGGILFAMLYWISLVLVELFFPGWIANTWNMDALSGFIVLGVPVEEIFFGFSFGMLWSSLFEEVCSNLNQKIFGEMKRKK